MKYTQTAKSCFILEFPFWYNFHILMPYYLEYMLSAYAFYPDNFVIPRGGGVVMIKRVVELRQIHHLFSFHTVRKVLWRRP